MQRFCVCFFFADDKELIWLADQWDDLQRCSTMPSGLSSKPSKDSQETESLLSGEILREHVDGRAEKWNMCNNV